MMMLLSLLACAAVRPAVLRPSLPTSPLLRLRGGELLSAMAVEELKLSAYLCQAALLGGLVGVERGWAGRPAGVRTMSLVSMGAALFTGVGRLSFDGAEGQGASRLAAQVVSGVGFIGAGVINARSSEEMRKRGKGGGDYLKGLTTATAIWLSAGIGVACGSGHGVLATAATILAVGILWCVARSFEARKICPPPRFRPDLTDAHGPAARVAAVPLALDPMSTAALGAAPAGCTASCTSTGRYDSSSLRAMTTTKMGRQRARGHPGRRWVVVRCVRLPECARVLAAATRAVVARALGTSVFEDTQD